MRNQTNFILQKKRWEDLNPSVRMYGTSEPPEMQLDNMWEVVSRSTGERLHMTETDFSEFSSSDKMYPSMMKPDVKRRWDMKQQKWKNQKEKYNRIERMARAQFVLENPDLKLAQDLAKTSYGKDILSEAMRSDSVRPATGTGDDLHDEFERDGVSAKSDENISDENIKMTPFAVAGMQDPYATLTTARDGDGRIVEKLLNLGTIYHHVQYDYDEGGRLSRVFNEGNVIESYEYGKFGERLFADTVSFGERQYIYDKSLKLIQAGEVKYYYDAKGRLVLKQDNGQITKYSYLPNGALHKAQLPDGRIIEYHFDSEGMRIAKSVNGTVAEKYLWKDFTTLEAVADGAARNVKVFAYDDEGDPVAMIYNDKMYYFASDQVGSIYMVADGNGNKVEQIICDSFGNLIVDTDGTIDIPLGFAAGLLDKDTGLVHFGYREYDPEIGRFTTPDPIGLAGGDVDVYGYCWDDPNNFVDRDGLKGKSEEKDKDGDKKNTKHEQIQQTDSSVPRHSDPSEILGYYERKRSFPDRVGSALGKIGGIAGEAVMKIAGEAGDAIHKKASPLTHPETKKAAQDIVRKRIKGESPSSDILKEGAKLIGKAWNNMEEKEKKRVKSLDKSAAKINSNSTQAEKIKAAIEPPLRGWARVYLGTPDPVVSTATTVVEAVDKVSKRKK